MYKGAVFFDYDGTITDESEGIFSPTPKTIYTLEKLKANGYATFLATGRMKPLTRLVSGKFTGLITCNGASVEIEGKSIYSKKMDRSLLYKTIDFMNREKIKFALETDICAYTNGLENEHFHEILKHFNVAKSLFKPIENISSIDTNKLMITYENEDKLRKFIDMFSDVFEIKPHRFCLSADVNEKNISKATGVKEVLKHLNIPKENTYAIGDGANDFAMLSEVGHPIVMKIHSKDLDTLPVFVTKSVKEDGIYFALTEHFKLI